MSKITLELGKVTPIEEATKQKQLQVLAKLNTNTLGKLVLMANSTKALSYLDKNWLVVKNFLSI